MNHAHQDQAGHDHSHGGAYGGHARRHAAPRAESRDAAFSLLRASVLARFAIAGAAIAAVWVGVFWAMT